MNFSHEFDFNLLFNILNMDHVNFKLHDVIVYFCLSMIDIFHLILYSLISVIHGIVFKMFFQHRKSHCHVAPKENTRIRKSFSMNDMKSFLAKEKGMISILREFLLIFGI